MAYIRHGKGMTGDTILDSQVRKKKKTSRNIRIEEQMKIIEIRTIIEIKNKKKQKQDKKAATDYEISIQEEKIVKKRTMNQRRNLVKTQLKEGNTSALSGKSDNEYRVRTKKPWILRNKRIDKIRKKILIFKKTI